MPCPLSIFYQEFNELFPLCLQVFVINAGEVVSVDDEGRNSLLL